MKSAVDPWAISDRGAPFQRKAVSFNADSSIDFVPGTPEQAPSAATTAAPAVAAADKHPTLEVSTLDASPGGYSMDRRSVTPRPVKTGDLICLRGDRDSPW
ncbi:hypothetical protein [Haliea sp.]